MQTDPEDFGTLVPLRRDGKMDGEWYAITEASEDATVRYRNASSESAVYQDGKVVKLVNIHDVEMLLVGLCVWKISKKGDALPACPVGVETVKFWPGKLVGKLYDIAKELSPSLLVDKYTVESLDKEISRLTTLREKIKTTEGEQGKRPTVDGTGSTGDTSSSPKS